MPKGYHHLTYDKRCQLYTLKARGDSQTQIARELKVDKSTICRELKRNRGKRGYRYKQAHEFAKKRRKKANRHRNKMTIEAVALIESKLLQQWSPEQISGWLKKEGSIHAVSHETIYQHIFDDRRRGGTLYKHLRHGGKKYNKRRSEKAGRGCIPNRVDIDQRPSVVEEKSRLGDWEIDTIIGKGHRGVIVSMVERRSKLTKLLKVSRKTSLDVTNALLQKLGPLSEFVLTITADNGKEFADHESVSLNLGAEFYFAKPYHSWERGLNEHTNGLVRQYFPKSMAFDEITQDQIEEVEIMLNKRPRKVLQYWTPIEVFEELVSDYRNIALRT